VSQSEYLIAQGSDIFTDMDADANKNVRIYNFLKKI